MRPSFGSPRELGTWALSYMLYHIIGWYRFFVDELDADRLSCTINSLINEWGKFFFLPPFTKNIILLYYRLIRLHSASSSTSGLLQSFLFPFLFLKGSRLLQSSFTSTNPPTRGGDVNFVHSSSSRRQHIVQNFKCCFFFVTSCTCASYIGNHHWALSIDW